MRFEFDSVDELDEFLAFCGRLVQSTPAERAEVSQVAPYGTVAAEPESRPEIAVPEPTAEKTAAAAPDVDPKIADQKRKRRTKAEMEAARAAEQAGNASPAGEAPTGSVSTNSPENATEVASAGNPFAQAEPVATATVGGVTDPAKPVVIATDAAEFIKSRLGERPEVSQVEHLNMARTFIGKHGGDKYNQSFALAGLTNNVMGYSTADCATHAAALDFLSLE